MGSLRLRHLGLAGLALVAMTFAACTRSASTPPTTGGAGSQTASPLTGQQATMEAVRSALLTQTAQAQSGGAATSTATAPAAVVSPIVGVGTPAVTVVGTTVSQVTPFPSPTPGKPSTYTLHEGEFPYCLARRFNVNPDDLVVRQRPVQQLARGSRTNLEHPQRIDLPRAARPAVASDQLLRQEWRHGLLHRLRLWRRGSGRYRCRQRDRLAVHSHAGRGHQDPVTAGVPHRLPAGVAACHPRRIVLPRCHHGR